VLSFGDDAFEGTVLDGMIFDLDGEALDGGIEAGALRDGPAFQDAVQFQAEIVVKPTGVVLLYDVRASCRRRLLAARFGRAVELPFAFVFTQAHGAPPLHGRRLRIACW